MTFQVKRAAGMMLVAVLLSSCGGTSSERGDASIASTPAASPGSLRPTGESPEAWAKRIAKAYDTRELSPKMSARDAKATAEAIDTIGEPLVKLRSSPI